MNTTKKVTTGENDKVLRAKNNIQDAKYYVSGLKAFKGCNNLEEVESMLIERTGFPNLRLASQALNLELEYLHVRDANITDFSIFNEDYTELNIAFIDGLKESCTTYYTAEETKVLKQSEKLIAEYNTLNLAVKGSIAINREGNLVMNESKYNYLSQGRF